jgi:hypothetical protein
MQIILMCSADAILVGKILTRSSGNRHLCIDVTLSRGLYNFIIPHIAAMAFLIVVIFDTCYILYNDSQ